MKFEHVTRSAFLFGLENLSIDNTADNSRFFLFVWCIVREMRSKAWSDLPQFTVYKESAVQLDNFFMKTVKREIFMLFVLND